MTRRASSLKPRSWPLHGTGHRADHPDGSSTPLRDGSRVLVRPVQRTDGQLLLDGFARLSPQARRMRFLYGKHELSVREVQYFTDIDHHDHEALGALDALTGRGVGIVRYIRNTDDPQSAELAISVVDDWQGRGLGTELMRLLACRARAEGVRYFTALVAADNRAVIALFRRMDADVEVVGGDIDTVRYEIGLRVRQPC